MIEILTFSSLYPNAAQPTHGVFVEERLRHLVATGEVGARVVAPVPWFPSRSPRFGAYARFAAVPRRERRWDIEVHHPRHLVIPKIGMRLAVPLMERGVEPLVRELVARDGCVLIDAHYLFPDGVAAARIARRLNLPYVLTARGSDVNLIGEIPWCRGMMREAIEGSAATVAVSEALRERLLGWGVRGDRVTVVRNGVDFARFRALPRESARRDLGLEGWVLLSVGKLDENKGHHLAIAALAELSDASLVIAGEGPMKAKLERQAAEAGVAERVRFAGAVPQAELVRYYSAADALVLASGREGLPNVVLESLACGTPVVATRVGGIPEVIDRPGLGELMSERSAGALAAAVRALRSRGTDREAVSRAARRFDWQRTSRCLADLLAEVACGAARDRMSAVPS